MVRGMETIVTISLYLLRNHYLKYLYYSNMDEKVNQGFPLSSYYPPTNYPESK